MSIKIYLDGNNLKFVDGVQTTARTLDSIVKGDNITGFNVKASAYLSENQLNLPGNVFTKVLLNTESYDVGADFDIANSKFVAPVAGFYMISGSAKFWDATVIADKRYIVLVYKNNEAIMYQEIHSALVNGVSGTISKIIYLNANDYLELFVYPNVGAGIDTVAVRGHIGSTYLTIHLLSV